MVVVEAQVSKTFGSILYQFSSKFTMPRSYGNMDIVMNVVRLETDL